MHSLENRSSPERKLLPGTLAKGFILPAGLALFLHAGISLAYTYLPGSIMLAAGMTICCFLIFWMNIKYDRYIDVNDVFLKTISFNDFNASDHKCRLIFVRVIRPLNPYIGLLGTISGLILMLCAVPALIIYWSAQPDHAGMGVGIAAYLISAGSGWLFYFSNKDGLPSVLDKALFFTGILLVPAGVIKLIS